MPGFAHCSWCNGKGCMCCDAEEKKWNEREQSRMEERDREYQRLFPNGPTPIFTARRDNPDDMEALKRVIGMDVLKAAFAPGGDGVGKVDPQFTSLVRGLANDDAAAEAVLSQYRGLDSVEKRAEIERFFQRHRDDPPEYKPLGEDKLRGEGS